MFKSLTFLVDFCFGINIWLRFHSFVCGYPVSQQHLLKRLSIPQFCILGALVKEPLIVHVGEYLGDIHSVTLVSVSVFMEVPYHFHYYSFVI